MNAQQQKTPHLFTIGIFLIGGVALSMPRGHSVGFYWVIVLGLAYWLKERNPLIAAETKHFTLPLLAYAAGNILLGLNESLEWRRLDPYLPFGLMLFGLWALRKYRPRAIWFWTGLAVGAMGAAAISGYQAISLQMRAQGFSQAIQFGNVALLLGVLCMVRAVLTLSKNWINSFLWVGFVAGLAASVWSQSRGGWLAVLLIFIWIVVNATKNWPSTKRGVAALLLMCVILAPALQPNGVVQTRIAHAATEFMAYIETGKQDSSVGARLAMWRIGFEEIGKAPWLGVGDQGWVETRDAAIADTRLDKFSAGFGHLHNEYLDIAFKRGLVGLGLYLAMYLIPMMWFFKPHLTHPNVEVRSLAMAGMVIPMMFMDFALTQGFLAHNSGRMMLVSLWMCVAALMLNAIDQSKAEQSAA